MNHFYLIIAFLTLTLTTNAQNSSGDTPSSNKGSIEIYSGLTFSRATGNFVDNFEADIANQNESLGEDVNLNAKLPFEFGFEIGANYTYNINEKISISSGVGFWRTQLATRVNYEYQNPDFSYDEVGMDQTTFKFSYLALPIKVRYHLNNRLSMEAGVHFNFALKGLAEAVVESEREVIINGELDEEWTRPIEENTVALKDIAQSFVPQYRINLVYNISSLLNATIGFFGNGKHLIIEDQGLKSLGLQLGIRANLGNLIKL